MYYQPPHRLYVLAGGDGVLSRADVDDLLGAASRLTQWHSHCSPGQARGIVADVQRMVRRLDPSDPAVASFDTWLRERGVDPSREVEAAAEPIPPALPPAPPVEVEAAPPVATTADLEEAVRVLGIANENVRARSDEHASAVRSRDAAKVSALEEDTPAAWDAYHRADRRCIELEALVRVATDQAAAAADRHATTAARVRETAFADAVARSSDEALAAALTEAVRLRREIAVLEEQAARIAYAAARAQNAAADEAFTIGRACGLTEAEITRRMRRAELALEGATHRGPRAVMAMLAALAATPEHRATAEGATTSGPPC